MISEDDGGDVPGDIAGEGFDQRRVAVGRRVAIRLIDEWVNRGNWNEEENNVLMWLVNYPPTAGL